MFLLISLMFALIAAGQDEGWHFVIFHGSEFNNWSKPVIARGDNSLDPLDYNRIHWKNVTIFRVSGTTSFLGFNPWYGLSSVADGPITGNQLVAARRGPTRSAFWTASNDGPTDLTFVEYATLADAQSRNITVL